MGGYRGSDQDELPGGMQFSLPLLKKTASVPDQLMVCFEHDDILTVSMAYKQNIPCNAEEQEWCELAPSYVLCRS